MNRNDINRMYTEQVESLLAQGYQIYPYTMAGTQGEIAHIDLTNGSEILRVLIDCESSFTAYDLVTITVGKNTDRIRGKFGDTIWNNHLEVLTEIKLAKISDSYFTTPGEAEIIKKKRFERCMLNPNRYDYTIERRELGEAYKAAALRWLRRQPRMKTTRPDDITRMTKETHSDGTFCYRITAKGRDFTLAAQR